MAPNLPPIPIPTPDIKSLHNTVTAMRQYLLAIGGLAAPKLQPYTNPLSREPVARQQPTEQVRWVEHSRDTEFVKIVNPEDETQFVVVQRINQLIHKDTITGEHWAYNRGPAGDTEGKSAQGTDGGTPILKTP